MSRLMKDSGIEWIGEIPESWKLQRMKRCITSRVSGDWGEERKDNKNDVICLRIADFNYKSFTFKDIPNDEYTVRNYDKEVIKKLLLKHNDILIEKSGGGDKTPVGRCVIFNKKFDALYANFMDRIRVNKSVYAPYFLYILNCFYLNRYTLNYIKQTTGIQNLDITSMLSCECTPIPSLDEQKKIAAFLDEKCGAIDEIISKTEQSIEEYKKLKQSVITKAVTKCIRPNRPMQDSNIEWIGEIPTDWEIMKLKFVFEIKKDIAGKEGYTVLSITQTGIKPKNITSNEGQQASDYSKYQLVDKGDFAMNHMDLLTGWVDISKYDGVTSPDYRVFRLKKINNCDRYFLYMMQLCYLNKIFYGFGQGVSGFGRWRLPADMFLNFLIPIPPLDEQKEIADYLDEKCAEIDTLIEKKQQFLAEIANYKKSLIYEYVTGKKEVA